MWLSAQEHFIDISFLSKCIPQMSRGGMQIQVFNPQKATLGIRTSKATWGQMWPHHENGYN